MTGGGTSEFRIALSALNSALFLLRDQSRWTQRDEMPYSYRIDSEHEVVLFKATRLFSADELAGCLKEVVSDPKFKRTFNHLVDLREVTEFPVSGDQVRQRAEADKKMNTDITRCRIAIVSSTDFVFGMTRIYEIMMEEAPPEIHTFRNIRDATKWLDIPESVVGSQSGP